jgi:hypothetical protein
MRTFLAGLLATVALPCSAADISIKGSTIFIAGTIDRHDYEVFLDKTKFIDQPMAVVLHSKGGLLGDAFRIGRMIRDRGWDTICEFVCESAAGWMWLAGSTRLKTPNAQIGFHAPANTFTKVTSDVSVEVVKRYVTSLGYAREAAEYTVSAPYSGIRYLTVEDAERVGITYITVPVSIPISQFKGVDLYRRPDPKDLKRPDLKDLAK